MHHVLQMVHYTFKVLHSRPDMIFGFTRNSDMEDILPPHAMLCAMLPMLQLCFATCKIHVCHFIHVLTVIHLDTLDCREIKYMF